MNSLIHGRRRIKRGHSLYRVGDSFHSLFVVRRGFFKSSLSREDGLEQITGLHMMGEVMGMDGIGSGKHASGVVALEDGEVCELSYQQLTNSGWNIPGLQHHFQRMMSREIVREQSMLLVLGSMRKEQRLASFLLTLSQRCAERGQPADEITLCMTREEIGSYLGMTLETVSRLFSRFRSEGLIDVRQKYVRILDAIGLEALKRPGHRLSAHDNA